MSSNAYNDPVYGSTSPATSPFSIGDNLSGEIGINASSGRLQRLSLNGNTLFGINGGSYGDQLTLIIDWSSGNQINFSGIRMPPDAASLLPVTLDSFKTYKLEFQHLGGAWQLLSMSPPLQETID